MPPFGLDLLLVHSDLPVPQGSTGFRHRLYWQCHPQHFKFLLGADAHLRDSSRNHQRIAARKAHGE